VSRQKVLRVWGATPSTFHQFDLKKLYPSVMAKQRPCMTAPLAGEQHLTPIIFVCNDEFILNLNHQMDFHDAFEQVLFL
jgi:hypothetical protein